MSPDNEFNQSLEDPSRDPYTHDNDTVVAWIELDDDDDEWEVLA